MYWFKLVLSKAFVFEGRSRRKEYWMFILFNALFAIAALILDVALGLYSPGGVGPIYLIYSLIMVIPGISVAVRRLHDTGKSGWMYLLVFLPIIGFIWLLVLFCTDSDPGENEYGPNPKEVEPIAGF